MITLMHIVGERPNFMKLAPVSLAGQGRPDVRQVIVHTGQHYDHNMTTGEGLVAQARATGRLWLDISKTNIILTTKQ